MGGAGKDLFPRMVTTLRGFLLYVGRRAKKVLRLLILVLGVIALIMIALAFTRLPFDAHRSLATAAPPCTTPPDLVLVLGGSGMPSGPELLRLHHGALEAARSPLATVLVVHPKDSAVMAAMVEELVLKGVKEHRVQRIMHGTSTREQALEVAAHLQDHTQLIAVVTAPENIYRSVKALSKAGLTNVCGVPAYDHAMFVDLDYDHKKVGGKVAIPDVSGSLDLRYNFWNYLKLEVTCMREYAAIGYYWLNGWI